MVGGRLATDADARLAVGSQNKTQWALRGAPAQPRVTLVAQRLGANDIVRLAAEATTGYDYSGLTDWGPTYYAPLRLDTMGCWRISVEGGDPDDAIVLLVTRRTS